MSDGKREIENNSKITVVGSTVTVSLCHVSSPVSEASLMPLNSLKSGETPNRFACSSQPGRCSCLRSLFFSKRSFLTTLSEAVCPGIIPYHRVSFISLTGFIKIGNHPIFLVISKLRKREPIPYSNVISLLGFIMSSNPTFIE